MDGQPAYQDGPSYTAPEMRPGHGENLAMRPSHSSGGLAATLAMPVAALATDHALAGFEPGHTPPPDGPRFAFARRVIARLARRPVLTPRARPADLLPIVPATGTHE